MSRPQHAIKQLGTMPLRQSISPITVMVIETRLESIEQAMIAVQDEEIDRYFPIAAVACLEKACRWAIRSLLESGEPYSSRASKLFKEKFDINDVLDIEAKVVSTAEIVAHLVSISSLDDVDDCLSTLMNCRFKSEISTAKRKWNSIGRDKKAGHKLLPYSKRVFKAVDLAFKLRHSFCHELDYEFILDANEIRFIVNRTISFTLALMEFIKQELNSGAQTQSDMNNTGAYLLKQSEKKLSDLSKRIKNGLSPGRYRQFLSTQNFWQKYANKAAKFESDQFKGGTIAPSIYYSTLISLTEARCVDLETIIKSEIEFFSSADSKQIRKWARQLNRKDSTKKVITSMVGSKLGK